MSPLRTRAPQSAGTRVQHSLLAAVAGALVLLLGLSTQGTWARWGDSQQLTREEQITAGELSLRVSPAPTVTVYGVQDTPASDTRSIPNASCKPNATPRPVSEISLLSELAPAGSEVADVCVLDQGATELTVSAGDLVVIENTLLLRAVGKNLTGNVVVKAAQNPLPEPYEYLGATLQSFDGSRTESKQPDADGRVRFAFQQSADNQTFTLATVVRVAGFDDSISEADPQYANVKTVPDFTVWAQQGER